LASSGRTPSSALPQDVDPEQLRGCAHLGTHGQGGLVEVDADLALVRHLLKRAGDTPSRRILHGDHGISAGLEGDRDQPIQWRDV